MVTTHRYEKQVPGHHIHVDVKFLKFKDIRGKTVKRNQYTAIDDATRIRALRVLIVILQPTRFDLSTMSLRNSLFAFIPSEEQIMVTSYRQSSISICIILASIMFILSRQAFILKATWNDLTAMISRSFTSYYPIRVMSI